MNLAELQSPPNLTTMSPATHQPELEDVMIDAENVAPQARDLTYYKPLLHKLHGEKGMIARDIVIWLSAKGCGDYSIGQIYRILRK